MCRKFTYLFFVLLLSLALTSVANAALVYDTADSDIAVEGDVTGSYTDTQASDDTYEAIEEANDAVYSSLEHKWTFDVTGGDTVVFCIEAYCTDYNEPCGPNDGFVFAYSTDGSTYTDMGYDPIQATPQPLTISKNADDDKYQGRILLPKGISGTVYIRVKDTDETAGSNIKDTLYIDHMYIVSGPDLVGFYHFDGDYSDSSDWANDGIPMGNNISIVDDSERGLVLDLHSEDQAPTVFGYLDLEFGNGEAGSLIIKDTITTMAWIWVRSFSTGDAKGDNEWEGIITKGHDWRLTRSGYNADPPAFRMQFHADGTGEYAAIGTTDVWDGLWHHVAGVYDPNGAGPGNAAKLLYVDGKLEGTETGGGLMAHYDIRPVWIGGQCDRATPGDFTRYFDGRINDARIYNRPLTASEIDAIYVADMTGAHYPDPSHKSTVLADKREGLNLDWEPGVYAEKHDVYFGDDPDALELIANDLVASNITLTGDWAVLDMDTTYYWQVDTVNDTCDPYLWPGGSWRFTTGQYLTMDDFTSYADQDAFEVKWSDVDQGYAYLDVEENLTPKSMWIDYANNLSPYRSGGIRDSGADPDWTRANITALDLYIRGDSGNSTAELAWVTLTDGSAGTKTLSNSEIDLQSDDWQLWQIPLKDFTPEVDLTDVATIAVGCGDGIAGGAAGDMYVDDIRLYVGRCYTGTKLHPADFTGPELIPDCMVDNWDLERLLGDWLVAGGTGAPPVYPPLLRYKLDGNALDSSGHNEHGSLYPDDVNGPNTVYDADRGKLVLDFDGVDDAVVLSYSPGTPYDPCDRFDGEWDSWAPLDPRETMTITLWIKADSWTDNHRLVEKGDMFQLTAEDVVEGVATVLQLDLGGWGPPGIGVEPALTTTLPSAGRWHHVAAVYDSTELAIWYDGVKHDSVPASGVLCGLTKDTGYWFYSIGCKRVTDPAGDHFPGLMSDVTIYDYALNEDEIRADMTGAPTDLLLHYKLDGDANDSSGHGEDGTVIGGAVFVADSDRGTVLSLDGSDDCIDLSATPGLPGPYDFNNTWAPLDPCGPLTISAWFNSDAWAASDQRIIEKYDQFRIRTVSSGTELQVDLEGWGPNGIVPGEFNIPVPSTGVWHHVAATFDGVESAM